MSSGADRQLIRGHVPEAVARLGLQPAGRLPGTNCSFLILAGGDYRFGW